MAGAASDHAKDGTPVGTVAELIRPDEGPVHAYDGRGLAGSSRRLPVGTF